LGQLFETHPAQGKVELKIRESGDGRARLSAAEKEKDAIFARFLLVARETARVGEQPKAGNRTK
jgi:hypothetical protein